MKGVGHYHDGVCLADLGQLPDFQGMLERVSRKGLDKNAFRRHTLFDG